MTDCNDPSTCAGFIPTETIVTSEAARRDIRAGIPDLK